jgi:hypothetical protein
VCNGVSVVPVSHIHTIAMLEFQTLKMELEIRIELHEFVVILTPGVLLNQGTEYEHTDGTGVLT